MPAATCLLQFGVQLGEVGGAAHVPAPTVLASVAVPLAKAVVVPKPTQWTIGNDVLGGGKNITSHINIRDAHAYAYMHRLLLFANVFWFGL